MFYKYFYTTYGEFCIILIVIFLTFIVNVYRFLFGISNTEYSNKSSTLHSRTTDSLINVDSRGSVKLFSITDNVESAISAACASRLTVKPFWVLSSHKRD